jgi:hypothetical protein
VKDRGGPRGPQREDRVRAGDERPQPTLLRALFRRRFVDAQHVFAGELLHQFFVSRPERRRRLSLQLDHPAWQAGLIEDLFQEERHAALALFEAAHEQRHERHQPWSGLTDRHAGGQFAAGGDSATRTDQSMPLIFGDDRPDLGPFPHLMPPRLGIMAGQAVSAAAAAVGLERDHLVALLGRNERPLVFGMSRLPAPFLAALLLRRRRLGMRRLGARRQRRIAGRFLQRRDLRFQGFHPSQQRLDKRPHARRHLGVEFRRNRQRQSVPAHGGNHRLSTPNRKDHFPFTRGVNGYKLRF